MDTQTQETWDQKANRERAERKVIVLGLEKRFKTIFRLLGFEQKPRQSDEFYDARSEGTKEGDQGIFLSAGQYRTKYERIEVSGVWPGFKEGSPWVDVWHDRDADGGKYDRVPCPSITVSVNKTDEQIAKDIERRFLPAYLDRLARVRKRIKETNEYNATTLNALETIKAIVSDGKGLDKYDTERKAFSEYFSEYTRIEVKVSGDTVTIELRCERDLAEKVARFIKKEAK